MSEPGRFAVLSAALPPSWSGQSVVLLRLLSGVDPGRYCLIGPEADRALGKSGAFLEELPAVRHVLPDPFQIRRGNRLGLHRVRDVVNQLVRMAGVVPKAWRIARILRRERCEAVVACSGDVQDLPAACLAARWTGARLFLYLFDDYVLQWTQPLPRLFAALVERWIVKRASGVIVPNEHLADALARRYGVLPAVVRNPCVLDPQEPRPGSEPRGDSEAPARIVYTGAIYPAQLDAVQNLLAALPRMRQGQARLHVYTAIAAEDLRRMGIAGPVEVHPHLDAVRVGVVQRQADLLFLPLAFESPYDPALIRTSAPGKTGEYLAARRPILVHAPADSFVAWYFRRHRCGWVVDQKDPDTLAAALDRLLGDPELCRELAERAHARACADFDASVSRQRFFEALARDGRPVGRA